MSPTPDPQDKTASLVVTGNPNVGKSVLFQLLTGRYMTVSNYPGTTVMTSRGSAVFGGETFSVFDTPGMNSLSASSEDELVARQLLLGRNARSETVLQVGDAKNLLRVLTLTLELAEAGLPMTLALNMIDEARERRLQINVEKLSELLGIPVVATIAIQRRGVDRLKRAIPHARSAKASVRYPTVVEEAAAKIESLLPASLFGRRALALLWLSGDQALMEEMRKALPPATTEAIHRLVEEAQKRSSTPLKVLIARARIRQARQLTGKVMTTASAQGAPKLQPLGDLAMHPVWGLFVLGAVLAVMYYLVGDLAAGRAVDFLESVVFGRFLVPLLEGGIQRVIPWAWLQNFLVGEYGVFTMALPYAFAIILPIVGMFFLFFGFIEDVGYLPRLAVMSNRFCRFLGLNGKAVLPLVLGLGCDTMATMTARILDSKRDRFLVTLILALGIPCSAQLGVILAMLASLSPLALWIWVGVLLTVIVAVGQTAAKLVPGEESPFLYEIPPLRRPKLSNIVIKTLGRLEWYLREAVPLFFLGTCILFFLDAFGWLAQLERFAAPLVVSWLGLPPEATEAFLVGFLRRDFGAAGLFALQRDGMLSGIQVVVSLVTITLFVPCIAQFFMMAKEQGWKRALGIASFVFGVAFLVGGVLFRLLTTLQVSL